MKKSLVWLCIVAILFSFCGCSILSGKDFFISYDLAEEPKNLDPQTASDMSAITIIGNIMEGLFVLDEFGEPKNGYVESYKLSQDKQSYTFTLRDDGLWENGDKVTAFDFEFGLRRLLLPETGSQVAAKFYSIKNAQKVHSGEAGITELGVKATAENTLIITLDAPNDNLLYLLASTYAMPCNEKFFKETKGKYGLSSSKVLSNGPFLVSKWTTEKSVRIVRSDNYYENAEVKPSGINLYFNSPQDTAERLLDKKISASFVTGDSIDEFSKKGFNTTPIQNEVIGIALNCQSKSFESVKFRRIVAQHFDRSLYESKLSNHMSVAGALIPFGMDVYGESFREYVGIDTYSNFFDVEDDTVKVPIEGEPPTESIADEVTDNGGEINIKTVSLIVDKEKLPRGAEYFADSSQILQREISLFVNVEELTTVEYNERIANNSYDMAIISLKPSDFSAQTLLSFFKSNNSQNISKYKNEEYDKLVDELFTKTQKNEILEICKQAEKKIILDAAFIPMAYATDYFVESPKVTGIVYDMMSGQVLFKNTEIS